MLRLALCALIFSSTQAVISSFALQVSFTEPHQCGAFTFSLQGQVPSGPGRPTSLSIIPFDSIPIVVPIPNPQSESAVTTLLPYPAGTQFVASLEDGTGATVIRVSQVMKVGQQKAEASNDCVDSNPSPVQNFAIRGGTPSQCEEFSVAYNTSAITRPPQVRAYNPQGFSFILNQTSADFITGTARYLMSVEAGKDLVLLIDGGNGIRETTEVFTVGGDPGSSSEDCLARQREVEATMATASKAPGIPSRSIIIGSAAGGGAVVLVAVVMCIYVVLERRRRRLHGSVLFRGSRMQENRETDEKKRSPLPTFYVTTVPSNGTTPEPSNVLMRSPKRGMRTDSLASWVQVTPEDQKVPASMRIAPRSPPRHQSLAPSLAQSESRNVMPQTLDDRDRLSINSLDIEGMLNMASMQSEAARKASSTSPSFFGTDLGHGSPSPPRIITDLTVPRRALKVNSDIPDDLRSAYSRDSVNPFTTPVYGPDSSERTTKPWNSPTAISPFASPRDELVDCLPVAPLNVGRATGRPPVGRSSSASGSEWYNFGIAR